MRVIILPFKKIAKLYNTQTSPYDYTNESY